MFRIAMKAPIMLASTAIHAVRLALSALRRSRRGAGDAKLRGASKCGDVRHGRALPMQCAAVSRAGRRGRGRAQCLPLGLDRRIDRHAGAQLAGEPLAGVEHDLHRDALHDLGEVAGRVVGRQQREFLAARRRDAVDMAVEGHAGKGVDRDSDRLAGMDIGELRLLVVGDDIGRRQRHHRHQLCPRLHILADAQRAVADDAVDRRR